jgi:hypothetical protein
MVIGHSVSITSRRLVFVPFTVSFRFAGRSANNLIADRSGFPRENYASSRGGHITRLSNPVGNGRLSTSLDERRQRGRR